MQNTIYTNVATLRGQIHLRGYENGKRVHTKIGYKPYLFVDRPGDYQDIYGNSLSKMQFDSIYDAKAFTEKYKDVHGFKFHGMTNWIYPFLNDYYPGKIMADLSLMSVASLDIEVETLDGFPTPEKANQRVTVITLCKRKKFRMFGLSKFRNDDPENTKYYHAEDEADLLKRFIECWEESDLDVVTGWNINSFDMPYLINRITKVLGEEWAKRISPWGVIMPREFEFMGRVEKQYTIYGISQLDYMEVYKKFAYRQHENFKLDTIAYDVLKINKLDYSEYRTLQEMFEKNPQKYMEYNKHDVVIIDKLEEKLGLLSIVYSLAYSAKINFIDTYSSVRTWDVIIHNYLMSQGIAIPQLTHNEKLGTIEGAYVKEPQKGKHEWVASFDVASEYPSIIIQHNISPECYVGKLSERVPVDQILAGGYDFLQDKLKKENITVTGAGVFFSRDKQGFLAKLMADLFDDRQVFKKKMLQAKQEKELIDKEKDPEAYRAKENEVAFYNNQQHITKIKLNSGYGALTNAYFRWYNNDMAESITLTGQVTIKSAENCLNRLMNKICKTEDEDYIIAVDTDSNYLRLERLVNAVFADTSDIAKVVKFVDKACEQKFVPALQANFAWLAEYLNAYEPRIVMKREAIANKAIWTGKKRYMMSVYNNEGVQYAEPELKMMGIEAIKSSTPIAIRNKIKEAIKLTLTTDESTVQKFIAEFKKEFFKLPFSAIAFPRTVNNLAEYSDKLTVYRKGTPLHVRGSLLYNKLLKDQKLDKYYPSAVEGEKIKYCYLKEPNPIRDDVICVPDVLPKEFGLEQYLDYEKMFTKSFLDPLETILTTLQWDVEKRNTLASFFGA